MAVPLLAALRAAHSALEAEAVPHAIAGGLAVNVWGRPRETVDVDLALAVSSIDELTSLVTRIQPRGFLRLDPRPLVFSRAWVGRLALDPDIARGLGRPITVDLVRPAGRGGDAWSRALLNRAPELEVFGETLRVVSPEDLVLFKLLVREDRGYDLEDARSVVERVGRSLDSRYLVSTALRLGVRGRLRRLGI